MKKQRGVAFFNGKRNFSDNNGGLFEDFVLPEGTITFVSFSATDEQILSEFAETIIPTTTSSGGAKAGNRVHLSHDRDCYPLIFRNFFANGLKEMQIKSIQRFNKDFLSISEH
jgi:hypothetical protein